MTMKMAILQIPGSERFCADGKRPDKESISPKLKIFPYDEAHEIDPITLEVVAHKLWQINDEQGQALKKKFGLPGGHRRQRFQCRPLRRVGRHRQYRTVLHSPCGQCRFHGQVDPPEPER